jgi:hypothetical protein
MPLRRVPLYFQQNCEMDKDLQVAAVVPAEGWNVKHRYFVPAIIFNKQVHFATQ